MRLSLWVTAAALLLATAAPARAQEAGSTYRAVIDRADLEPASVGGYRLRVYVSALSLDGQILDLTEPKSLKLTASRTEIRAPYALGSFAAAQTDLAMVLVVQATAEYADVLRTITEAADTGLLEGLPDRTQVGIVTYGETVGAAKLGSLKAARAKLRQITAEGAVPEPALLDALDRGLRLLKGAKTEPPGRPLRKLIVVVSDGRDRSNDRDRVTALGKRASAAGVRIHTFAHAPNDVRRPLLLLGELSKRSFGTFRWLRKDATTVPSWQARFQQLLDEVKQQYVLTYFVDEDLAGRELKLASSGRTVLASLNELKVPAAGCNGETCDEGAYCAETCMKVRRAAGRGMVGWIFLVVVIVLGAIFVLGAIGFVLTKRQQARSAGAGPGAGAGAGPGAGTGAYPGQVPGSFPPGQVPGSFPPGQAPGSF
ncbi:MAG TPA: vWA domain-containing protein, partial [Kofleriaceae bacterium]|nr:vWA domain-containing protein [Kofleriaceae bacterium]